VLSYPALRSTTLVIVNPAICSGYEDHVVKEPLDAEDWWVALNIQKHYKILGENYTEVSNSIKDFLHREWVGANEIAVACLDNQTVLVSLLQFICWEITWKKPYLHCSIIYGIRKMDSG
jgi:hypothetical protein